MISMVTKVKDTPSAQDLVLYEGNAVFSSCLAPRFFWQRAFAKYHAYRKGEWRGAWCKQGWLHLIDFKPAHDYLPPMKKPLRFIYFWPLEITERLLRNAADHPWHLIWLLSPENRWVLIAYHQQKPLFFRALPATIDMSAEILETQAYLKRFGYEKNTPLRIWLPKGTTLKIPNINYYVLPQIYRPWIPLKVSQLARAQQLFRLPRWLTGGLSGLGLFLMMGVYTQWQEIKTLRQEIGTLSSIASLPISTAEQNLFREIQPYWQQQKGLFPFAAVFQQRQQFVHDSSDIPRPQTVRWQAEGMVLEYATSISATQKRQLSKKFPGARWEGLHLYFGKPHE